MRDGSDHCIGIEIGGTKLQLVSGNASGKIERRWRATVDPVAGGKGICRQIQTGLAELRKASAPQAIGVGFGGPVDWRTGRICCSHQIEGWEDFGLGDWLRKEYGLPAAIDNDANVAALGEAKAGAGSSQALNTAAVDLDPLFYVTLGSGVGGGLVVGGKIYHGASPGESEFGHLRLDRSGTIVESRCSGWAVDARIRAAVRAGQESALTRLAAQNSGNEAKHLAEALRQDDPIADMILTDLADDLAFALSHVIHLMHPRLIVLGGGLSLLGEPLGAKVQAGLLRYVMKAFQPAPIVRLAALREDSVPAGALILAGNA